MIVVSLKVHIFREGLLRIYERNQNLKSHENFVCTHNFLAFFRVNATEINLPKNARQILRVRVTRSLQENPRKPLHPFPSPTAKQHPLPVQTAKQTPKLAKKVVKKALKKSEMTTRRMTIEKPKIQILYKSGFYKKPWIRSHGFQIQNRGACSFLSVPTYDAI